MKLQGFSLSLSLSLNMDDVLSCIPCKKTLISTILYVFYDFMKYTALLNVLISPVLLPLW